MFRWLKSKLNSSDGNSETDNKPVCSHYNSPMELYFPCCATWLRCLRCHRELRSEADQRQFPFCEAYTDASKRPTLMRCVACGEEQSLSQVCVKCGAKPKYFCDICYIWDDTGREIFHCDACGICRVGRRTRVFHCDGCGTCLDKKMEGRHRCLKDGMMSDCAICLEPLFSSNLPACQLPRCGHSFHQRCLKDLFEYNPGMKCPMCKRELLSWMSDGS
eukprot:Blabericola_migrator_1__829@NODE_1203_length_5119_cov_116_367577_g815_i0_p3_GENE_NODE_1203_length_5119_cov_116_367577_g815_i0NODE_1203_length_5119_cov_116_367577_g815_i0_p3_ORF_typecomplete_len218_score15_17zfCHY/PF05495_12/2_3e11zfRING_2/PF13639_6/9_8e03zfRING_2/PF13639_6/1_8e09zfC3HC4/PF00097_25/8_8e03zfC3HC4/PF00097_25/7_4e03zfC3HC4/PF00097_25/1e03zfC3HC4/PF00097_25/1_2e07zfRING_5/PF14634_6/1_8e07zfC3HC4_2/PF13923_6/4_3e03zfC3HC4_2/PF13923_6/8_2e03zfC3HC4_2/PF13923_6/2_1e03zfC3HC4_2/PF13923_6